MLVLLLCKMHRFKNHLSRRSGPSATMQPAPQWKLCSSVWRRPSRAARKKTTPWTSWEAACVSWRRLCRTPVKRWTGRRRAWRKSTRCCRMWVYTLSQLHWFEITKDWMLCRHILSNKASPQWYIVTFTTVYGMCALVWRCLRIVWALWGLFFFPFFFPFSCFKSMTH